MPKSKVLPMPVDSPFKYREVLLGRIRAAIPLVQHQLADRGYDPDTIGEDDRHECVARLAGVKCPNVKDQDIERLIDYLDAMFAYGIAVGVMFKPEAFLKGGAR